MKKIVIFGAGNIGRSFIAQLFSKAGYEIVFIEIDSIIIQALNKYHRYRIEIKDAHSETIWVENARGINSKNYEKVRFEISTADVIATALGSKVLPDIYEDIACGLLLRRKKKKENPLNIIICENLRNAKEEVYCGLKKYLPPDFPEDEMPGLIETSIGKMVPIMRKEEKKHDPLLIYAEAFNTLILDKKGFKGEIPDVKGFDLKENMKAYVDRKLFIHNLGHSTVAYLGYVLNSDLKYIWEAVAVPEIEQTARAAMWESGYALIKEYPLDFNENNQKEHIEDLLKRFKNRFLNDTIYRVGRDITRKLEPEDRLVGAIKLDRKHGVNYDNTAKAIASAVLFRAKDESGKLFHKDEIFVKNIYSEGIEKVLTDVCKFNKVSDSEIIEKINLFHEQILESGIF
ncbi:mannitol-1-phosphate 5-dehydrogenase [candidate division KSB1 bacterium]